MNYRHAYHAGNFADVHKHVALVAILACLKKKDAPFAAIDTHAGRGRYDLKSTEALRTEEARDGIARLVHHQPQTVALAAYLETVRMFLPDRYPGSPLIVSTLLRPQDRLVAVEKHPGDFGVLRDTLRSVPAACAMCADGYPQLLSLLPPQERRGLVLIDPPYEDAAERQLLAKAFSAAYRRFPTGIYVVWHPLKSIAPAEALAGEMKTAGATRILSLTLDVGRGRDDQSERLSGSGLLVANPPYGFDTNMHAAQAELITLLRRSAESSASVKWLVGGAS